MKPSALISPKFLHHRPHNRIHVQRAVRLMNRAAAPQFTFSRRVGVTTFAEQAGEFAFGFFEIRQFGPGSSENAADPD